MKILVNAFHPNLDKSVVNKAWLARLAKEENVTVRHIDEIYPDGKIDIAAEQSALLAHDRLVFQNPFYWYSVPPLMKQWIDDVFTYNWAYGPKGNALAGKEWVSVISTGGPADSYQAGGYNGYSMSEFLKPLQQTANLVQTKFLPSFIFHGAVSASEDDVARSAEEMVAYILDPLLDPQKKLAMLLKQMENDGISL
ncbi:MAG: NAD(P)H-dependent oxidoreductase [Neisseria sp.]|uniref:NAD(P)H-dependent oxidoreductase n=1 Tax=Neisseria sp. TaxID=192066 RepID=UPI0026DCCB67|nr:NAD(P)H-dependent oxidoreductase [Neisseria sp.]MDO4641256.1 NAD(P)H-dependent oxidoreductase [Neisseria sp.]